MRSYPELKSILELWEQGMTKMGIAIELVIPRATVRDCINRYGSVERLDAVMRGELPVPTRADSQLEDRNYIIPQYTPAFRRYTKEELTEAVATSFSLAEVLRKLNIRDAGGNYLTLKQRIKEMGLDTSHFTGSSWLKGRKNPIRRYRSLDEILVKDSTFMSTDSLRKHLIAEGIFPHQCVSCGLSEWLERPIPLELDHINGDRRDNRLENLRLLCPNCHALTATYRGKNKGANNA
jgi:HNH endonuclease